MSSVPCLWPNSMDPFAYHALNVALSLQKAHWIWRCMRRKAQGAKPCHPLEYALMHGVHVRLQYYAVTPNPIAWTLSLRKRFAICSTLDLLQSKRGVGARPSAKK